MDDLIGPDHEPFSATVVLADGTVVTCDEQRDADLFWALATGAVIAGRRTFEHADRWQGDHPDGVPIFILTHHVDENDVPPGSARFVTDVAECAALAKEAAGDRNVMVHGAGAAQALLRAGLLDEMELSVVNVLMGQGRRLFDNLPPEYIELEQVRQLADRDVTHLHYKVVR